MSRTIPTVLVLLSGLGSPVAAQAVHKVPQDHPTIQAAVTAAADGDAVQISGGTYPESVVVTGKLNLLIQAKGKVVIDPPAGSGLVLDGCGDCRVEKVRVAGGAPNGILLVDTTDTVLSKCRVDDSTADGIRIEGGGNNTVDRCTVKQAGNDAVALSDSAGTFTHDNLVSHGMFVQAADDGVDIEGDHNTVDHCTILKAVNHGAIVGPPPAAHDNVLTGCKLIKAGEIGVLLDGDDNHVRDCKVIQPADRGVHVVGGAGSTIEDCKFVKTGNDSVKAEFEAASVTVSGCKLTNSGDDGIEMDADNGTVEGNTVSGSDDDGIEIDGNDGSYTGNKSNGNGGDGFVLSEGVGNTLSANKAHGNKGFDLDDVIGGGLNTVDPTNKFGTTGP